MQRSRRLCSLLLGSIVSVGIAPAAFSADALEPSLPSVGRNEPAFPQSDGAELYAAICQACHMPNGTGAMGAAAYPALAKNPRLKAKAYPITRVLNGSKAMPAFRAVLTDAQVAAVVGFVRTHFDNHYPDSVSGNDVKALRQ